MKFSEINRGYGIETKVIGKDFQIKDLSNKLRKYGYQAGEMVSDFRPSYLITDAPLQEVKKINNNN